jgi:pimeloyl-ACP methyl ester carboxylesterase
MELSTVKAVSGQNKRPVLFVHGAWHGAWCWEENYMQYFADNGYTCHAFDLRGHGKKYIKGKRFQYRIKDYVKDLEETINQLSEKPVLIGHSMGGYIVQKYLEKNNVSQAILLATVPVHGAILGTLRKIISHPIAFLKMNLSLRLYPLVCTPDLVKDNFFSKDISCEKLDKYFSLINDESYLGFLDMVFLDLPKPNKNNKMLVIGAEDDSLFSQKEMRNTARAYDASLKIFPSMPHDIMLDKNWKEPADYILSWLNEINVNN